LSRVKLLNYSLAASFKLLGFISNAGFLPQVQATGVRFTAAACATIYHGHKVKKI
jgi:hypothetical protein